MVGLGGVTTDDGRVEVTDLLQGAWEDDDGVKEEEEEEEEVEKEEAKVEGRLRATSGSCPSDPCWQLEWAGFSRGEMRSSVEKRTRTKSNGLRMSKATTHRGREVESA